MILAATSILLLAPLSACSSSGATRSADASRSVDYTQLFASGEYSRAYEEASRAATSPRSGSDQPRAALIAGLSAQALNRTADAERWLAPLTTSGDEQIAGKACASLGLVALESGKHAQAADLLGRASQKLRGDEAARSALYAGDALSALGKRTEARAAYQRARELANTDTSIRGLASQRLAGMPATPPAKPAAPVAAAPPRSVAPKPSFSRSQRAVSPGYTVQVGAFSSFAAARTHGERFSRLGSVRIVETHDSGRRLFAVQVGRFPEEADAMALLRRVGRGSKVVEVGM